MEEKKTYPVAGTVTISTEEYRDLLIGMAEAKADADRKRSDWYAERQRADQLNKDLSAVKDELEKLRSFVNSKKDLKLAFKFFSAGITEDEEDA